MKSILILTLGLTTLIYSCKKDNDKVDYRDSVVGKYSGIRVDSHWIDTIVGYGHDTTRVIINITNSNTDSIIDIDFNPVYSNEKFSFKLENGLFTSTTNYHSPQLRLTKDSLYFKHQAGLGPIWTECFAKKIRLD